LGFGADGGGAVIGLGGRDALAGGGGTVVPGPPHCGIYEAVPSSWNRCGGGGCMGGLGAGALGGVYVVGGWWWTGGGGVE